MKLFKNILLIPILSRLDGMQVIDAQLFSFFLCYELKLYASCRYEFQKELQFENQAFTNHFNIRS